ncbi:MAG: hypothetical protein AB7S72_18665 [Draconibacterium sp.]
MKKITNDKKENAPLITRKQAIQKAGITALTAASVLFLSTKQSSAQSSNSDRPGRDWP